MKKTIDNSINEMWLKYKGNGPVPASWYFCDNQEDADDCAQLVQQGVKQATSESLWAYHKFDEQLPKVGDLNIITNWEGEAKAITQVVKVEIVSFKDISKEYAAIEGEGDKSLEYWKKVHWDFYSRQLLYFGLRPTEEMMIVCEYFKTVYS